MKSPNSAKDAPKQPGKKGPQSGQPVVLIKPMAERAKMRRRHWGVLFSFLILVVLPIGLSAYYFVNHAENQYRSVAGFTVRQEEGASASDLLGGLAQFTGASSSPDGDVLYEFIRSPDIVSRIDQDLNLRQVYSEKWDTDPVFSLWPDASIEDLHRYWSRIVRVTYNQATGLIDLQVIGPNPEFAQKLSQAIVRESQSMVNALNSALQEDGIRYANEELESALERLKEARAKMTEFRTRTQIVDLEADIQGRMGVMSTLQQQLAEELVAFDELTATTRADDPRLTQAQNRIQVIKDRIAEERRNFALNDVTEAGGQYPNLIAEFEALFVEREFAEETYTAALAARDFARVKATRQSRYLAAYVQPTLPEDPAYPKPIQWTALVGLVATLIWSILVLVYYSVRDRR